MPAIDRRKFLKVAGGAAAVVAIGGAAAAQTGSSSNHSILQPGESLTVDCSSGTTTTSSAPTTASTVPPTSVTTAPPLTTTTTAPTTTTTAPAGTILSVNDDKFTYSSGWSRDATVSTKFQGDDHWSGTVGAVASYSFTGTQVAFFGSKASHHGLLGVSIDGGAETLVDQYSVTRADQVRMYTSPILLNGAHTITMRCAGQKNPTSSGTVVSVDRLDVTSGGTPGTTTSTTQPSSTTTTVPVTPGSLLVVGNQLRRTDGTRFVVNGTNQYLDSYVSAGDSQMPAVSDYVYSNRNAIAAELASFGVNMVRIPINNNTSSTYLNRLKGFVDALGAAGILSKICPFGGVTWAPSASNGQLAVNVWKGIGSPSFVFLETVNEPNQISDAAWLSGTIAEIDAMRAGGYGGPVFCDAQDWAWRLPVTQARAVKAHDTQVVFESHRYASDGTNQNRGSGDAASWVAEWSSAPDLCVTVGEYGWFNGNGTTAAISTWCDAMEKAIVKGVQDGWCSGATSWMWLWDQNSHITATQSPPDAPGNTDWYAISRGMPYTYNSWGLIARAQWSALS